MGPEERILGWYLKDGEAFAVFRGARSRAIYDVLGSIGIKEYMVCKLKGTLEERLLDFAYDAL